ncbi:MAG: SlyX family protein [Acinetobacter sp.]|nr:MAG: SlyX family protein [Acinetobacter sp.]
MSNPPSHDDYATLCKVVEDLQVKMTFLDDLVEQLNDQIARQNGEIVDLHKKMQFLYQRVESADLSEGIAPFDPLTNRPPHY